MTYPRIPRRHCSGPCDQGRRPCATPEACETEEAKDFAPATGIICGVMAGLAMWGAIALVLVMTGVLK